MPIVALLLLLACPIPAGEGRPALFVFELAGGATVSGEWLGFDAQGAELATGAGRTHLAPGELVLVSGESAPSLAGARPAADILLLPGPEGSAEPGDRLVGRLVGGDDVELRFLIDGAGEVVVPFEYVDRLLPAADRPLDRLARLAVVGFDDQVWRRRDDAGLDALAGVVAEVGAEGLLLESALGDLQLPWQEVLAMVLADTVHPGRDLQGWPVRLALKGGSTFAAGLLSVSSDEIVVSTQFDEQLSLRPSELAAMVLSDRSDQAPLLLADLTPVSVDEWPALGRDERTLFPWQRNLAVAGSMLRVDGLPRVTGLGVHAHSSLVFEVPPGARRLRVAVGLSDDVLKLPARGSVTFEILHEGRVLAAMTRIDEGDEPVVLQLDGLTAGQQLQFVVGDAGDHDAGDRAVWFDGVFGR